MIMKDWLKDIDYIVARHNDDMYDVALNIDCGWKHIKELDEQEAIQYIAKNLIEISKMPDRVANGLITTGFEFIYKDGTKKFFKI